MRRTFVMGDPQGPFAKTLEVLERHGALRGDRLAPDVVLVSIGDHFDYDWRNAEVAREDGLRLLRWLAAHDPSQAVLVLGNHDASRVMELATLTDDEFRAARTAALADEVGYATTYPMLPPAGVLARDYAAFSSEQRALVMELLLAGRFHLALSGVLADGRPALLTHAGVTERELALLGLGTTEPAEIAAALEAHLRAAVERVSDDWQRGELAPLTLEPLHITGAPGEEGGGLLYHRPSARVPITPRPRRFDPRTLPRGLTQVAGHSGHAKCVEELGDWATPAAKAREHGGIRTLRVDGDDVLYDLGVLPPAPGAVADLILVDPELRRVSTSDVALLPLAAVHARA